jgi:hypothetical protein
LWPNTSAKRRGPVSGHDNADGSFISGYKNLNGRVNPVLLLLAFPFEVGIGHDGSTFNTAYHTGLVFFLRDTIGDQATMGTGAGLFYRWRLWLKI